jgi:hypothetical protein
MLDQFKHLLYFGPNLPLESDKLLTFLTITAALYTNTTNVDQSDRQNRVWPQGIIVNSVSQFILTYILPQF